MCFVCSLVDFVARLPDRSKQPQTEDELVSVVCRWQSKVSQTMVR